MIVNLCHAMKQIAYRQLDILIFYNRNKCVDKWNSFEETHQRLSPIPDKPYYVGYVMISQNSSS